MRKNFTSFAVKKIQEPQSTRRNTAQRTRSGINLEEINFVEINTGFSPSLISSITKQMGLPVIYTIGVYGSSEREFFQKLIDNGIDSFCDIRRRRAVRGSQYSFANSERLQAKLDALSIRYLYEIGLTPTTEIMELQKKFDEANKIQRRQREELSDVFKIAYRDKILSHFNMQQFVNDLEKSGSKKIVLFCVEKSPNACHRSLVTNKMKELYPRIQIFNL